MIGNEDFRRWWLEFTQGVPSQMEFGFRLLIGLLSMSLSVTGNSLSLVMG